MLSKSLLDERNDGRRGFLLHVKTLLTREDSDCVGVLAGRGLRVAQGEHVWWIGSQLMGCISGGWRLRPRQEEVRPESGQARAQGQREQPGESMKCYWGRAGSGSNFRAGLCSEGHAALESLQVRSRHLPAWLKSISSFSACFHLYWGGELGEGMYFLNDLFL